MSKHKTRKALLALVDAEELACDPKVLKDEKRLLEEVADHVLMASYAKGIDLYTIDELGWQVQREVAELFRSTPAPASA